MNEDNLVYSNLDAMLKKMGGFRGSRYSAIQGLAALYDSGIKESSENYALLSPYGAREENARGNLAETVKFGLDFFASLRRPHTWHIFPGAPDGICDILTENGLVRAEDSYAMVSDLNRADDGHEPPDSRITGPLRDEKLAREWAAHAWSAFDSKDAPPEAFVSLAVNMALNKNFSLIHLNGEATGVLYASAETAGIYYVATKPESRRRGLGGLIVDGLRSLARDLGFEQAVLIATQSGYPLYLKHGFRSAGAVKIFRTG